LSKGPEQRSGPRGVLRQHSLQSFPPPPLVSSLWLTTHCTMNFDVKVYVFYLGTRCK
jgi:hypothetical protein